MFYLPISFFLLHLVLTKFKFYLHSVVCCFWFYQARRDDCVQKKRNVPQDIVDEKDDNLQVC